MEKNTLAEIIYFCKKCNDIVSQYTHGKSFRCERGHINNEKNIVSYYSQKKRRDFKLVLPTRKEEKRLQSKRRKGVEFTL